jgi:hypothetical protein
MKRNIRLQRFLGINLISVAISASILSIVGIGTISTVLSSIKLDSFNKSRNIALRAVQNEYENILLMNKTSFLQSFDLSNNNPISSTFSVSNLQPQLDSTGQELPAIGFVFVTYPERFASNPAVSDVFTVYIELRYRDKFSGDMTLKFSLIVVPPSTF